MRLKNRYWFKIGILALLLLALGSGLTFTGCATATVPRGWSGVTLNGDALYLGSMEGKLVSINAATGATTWSTTMQTSAKASGGFGCGALAAASVVIYGTPAAANDLVYVSGYIRAGTSEFGQLYAFAPGKDEPRWLYPRQDVLDGPIVGSPTVADGRVYFGSAEGTLYALDATSGDKLWQFDTGNKIWAAPAVADGVVYLVSFDKNLYALDAATGVPKWQLPTEGALVTTPLVYNGTIYIGSLDNYLYAVDTQGKLKWQFKGGNWFWATPVATDNTIYAPNVDGKVYILDASTGEARTEVVSLNSPVSSSPVLIGSALIVATESGKIYSLNTTSNQQRLLKDLARKVTSPLGAGDGVVYVHTQEKEALYALNTETGAELWSPAQLSSK